MPKENTLRIPNDGGLSNLSSESSISRVFQERYIYPKWFTKQKYKFYEKLAEINLGRTAIIYAKNK